MKVYLQINHLPTDRYWTTDPDEISVEGLDELKEFCEEMVGGKITYLNVRINDKEVYFNANILKDCVITLITEGEIIMTTSNNKDNFDNKPSLKSIALATGVTLFWAAVMYILFY